MISTKTMRKMCIMEVEAAAEARVNSRTIMMAVEISSTTKESTTEMTRARSTPTRRQALTSNTEICAAALIEPCNREKSWKSS